MTVSELDHLGQLLGERPARLHTLSGGDIARSVRVERQDGSHVMAKFRRPGQVALTLEASMLDDLRAAGLPVPETLAVDDDALVLAWVDGGGRGFDDEVQRAAGRAIATMHAQPVGDEFGYGHDTVMGSIPQPNAFGRDWIAFYRDRRLLYMAGLADDAGELPSAFRHRIDAVARRLGEWIDPAVQPSLVHGDLWGGNMLATAQGGACFIDPAIYRGDGEVDLALATLFGSVGPAFFEGYSEIRPLERGFMTTRRHLYQLYPLLMHVRLFGGSYHAPLDSTLGKLGV
ncbi:MAG: fructosamine kinase family protein [Luteibacter sp.]|uniref:fructosamine kinase family protein n=1 Tax=Luteibacter sp. TaxID=1886636 RepID=UPI0028068147|nr:fructosamine kinase family protein [Luteibacter sp.]MDQ7994771.1 fructosamine kinase family protein [Luteibacter sp.]MDQ8051033.1 fructosamine kinase family protein [Luteibacter sp.]